jgi:ParB family chromosome partitioning protein
MMRLGEVIENIEENWIFYEVLMQHKRMLHGQIDLLISEKMKFKNRI